MWKLVLSYSTVLILLTVASATVMTYCVNNCTEQANGDYNSCGGCGEIVTCSEGRLKTTPCAKDTYYDSVKKYCDWISDTCTAKNHLPRRETTSAYGTESSTPVLQTTEAPINDNQTHHSTFTYTRVQYQATPCLSDATAFKGVPVRSRIDCASQCKGTANCWYFQYITPQCLMYKPASPPCFVDIYRYNG